MKSILILFAVLTGFNTYADSSPTFLTVHRELQESILSVARLYDPQVVVLVRLEIKTEKRNLPATPFILSNLSIQAENGAPEWKNVEVTLYGQSDRFPTGALNLIRESVESSGFKQPHIQFQSLPKAPLKAETKPEPTKEHPFSKEMILFLCLVAFGFFGLILFFGLIKAALKSMTHSLESGFDGIQKAYSRSRSNHSESNQSTSALRNQSERDVSPKLGFGLLAYPEDACSACFMDCYWTEEDGYAAFLWRRMPVDYKKRLLSNFPFLNQYARLLMTVNEIDLNAIDDPYYLSPFPISPLDQSAVSTLIRKHPNLLKCLPWLRGSSFQLTALEKIKMLTQSPKAETVDESLFKIQPSNPRTIFAPSATFSIRSIEEEEEIVNLKGLTLDHMAELPSLAWILQLDSKDQEGLLANFSARELASAWIGPAEILNKLLTNLPSKKKEMVQSYLLQQKGSRNNEVFRKLHSESIRMLRESAPKDSLKNAA